MSKLPLSALVLALALTACNTAKTPVTPPKPKVTSTAKPTAPAVSATELKGISEVGGKPLANAQIKVMDALTNKPLGIVAAGAGNIVAQGAGNIVAQGAGNIVAQGAGNYRLQATQVKLLQTDAKGAFHLAVSGLAPGHVARVIATVNGKTVTCLVGGDGKSVGGKAKGYMLSAVGDTALVSLGTGTYKVTSSVNLTMSPATTALDNSYKPMIGMLGRLDAQARADNLAKLFEEASQSEDELEARFDADPTLAEKWLAAADPNTGDLPDALVTAILNDAGLLDDVQQDARWVAEDTALEEKDADNLASESEQPPDTWDEGYAALGMSWNDNGQLMQGSEVVETVPEVDYPTEDTEADPVATDEAYYSDY
ncbi:MAG: hypothetical protein JWM80_5458 [Cyanobacteria bacterium RYN_339]|nr:hypothetical protein [Cyanobacteria bacterium RYN_339]